MSIPRGLYPRRRGAVSVVSILAVFHSPEDKCSVRRGLGHSACPCSVGGRCPGALGRWPAGGRAPGTGGSGLVPPRRMGDRLHWTLGPGGGGGDRSWKKQVNRGLEQILKH